VYEVAREPWYVSLRPLKEGAHVVSCVVLSSLGSRGGAIADSRDVAWRDDDLELLLMYSNTTYFTIQYQTAMSAPFFRAIRASLVLDGVTNCTCRHALRLRKVRGAQQQLRCLSGTLNLQSGHS
jgi:hypothetical protein